MPRTDIDFVLRSPVDFGRHRGLPWNQVPSNYLRWVVGQGMGVRTECAKRELERRGTTTFDHLIITAHAVDRASIRLFNLYQRTRSHPEHGIQTWLYQRAMEAYRPNEEHITKDGINFRFGMDGAVPCLVTVTQDKQFWRTHHRELQRGVTPITIFIDRGDGSGKPMPQEVPMGIKLGTLLGPLALEPFRGTGYWTLTIEAPGEVIPKQVLSYQWRFQDDPLWESVMSMTVLDRWKITFLAFHYT